MEYEYSYIINVCLRNEKNETILNLKGYKVLGGIRSFKKSCRYCGANPYIWCWPTFVFQLHTNGDFWVKVTWQRWANDTTNKLSTLAKYLTRQHDCLTGLGRTMPPYYPDSARWYSNCQGIVRYCVSAVVISKQCSQVRVYMYAGADPENFSREGPTLM